VPVGAVARETNLMRAGDVAFVASTRARRPAKWINEINSAA
jgi:hypothetical protein